LGELETLEILQSRICTFMQWPGLSDQLNGYYSPGLAYNYFLMGGFWYADKRILSHYEDIDGLD
jgi:hypothetical protein